MDHRIASVVRTALFGSIGAMPWVALAAPPAEAKALSERAAAYIAQVGEAKAFADFTRPHSDFVRGGVYMLCHDRDGINETHGAKPLFLGKDLRRIADPDGKEANFAIVKTGFEQGRGWVDFKWPNPMAKTSQQKSAYVIDTNDVVCGVAYYK